MDACQLEHDKIFDLHCHILPSIDDGAASLEEALWMARFSVDDGITHIAATPHCHAQTRLLRDDILPLVEQFNTQLVVAKLPLTVLPGSEIQVQDIANYQREFDAGLYCHLGDGDRYTLMEFPWRAELYPVDAPQLVTWLIARGMTPIIAHPERYVYFNHNPSQLQRLIDAGAWLQITVDSLLGNHGPAPQQSGQHLLLGEAQTVLATDAHNRWRCSGLSAGYAWVKRHISATTAASMRQRAELVRSTFTHAT